MPWGLAARDLGIVAVGVLLFHGANALHAWGGSVLTAGVAVLTAAIVAFVVNYIAHEWGHLAGARAAGGIAMPNPLRSIQLFRFDADKSSALAFQSMGWGGNLAPWVVATALAVWVAPEGPGHRALVTTALAGALFVNLIELPILARAARGQPPAPPPGAARFTIGAALAATIAIAVVVLA